MPEADKSGKRMGREIPLQREKKESNDKIVNNIISYFSENAIAEQFKNMFLEKLNNDVTFQTKLQEILDSENKPNDEILWKKIIECNTDLLSREFKEMLSKKFKEKLQEICQKSTFE